MKEKIVQQLILRNYENKDETLNLSNLGLSEIPKEIFNLEHLKVLKLMDNKILVIPNEIGKLKYLTHLYLYNNRINKLPKKSLKKMHFLKCIDIAENYVDYNEVYEIYKYLSNWEDYGKLSLKIKNSKKDTKWFHFWGKCKTIPKELFEFTELENLSLSLTDLKKIPKSIGKFKKLKSLSLSGSKINDIPSEIFNLENLEEINFDNNRFKEFPKQLLKLKKLKSISFNFNKIRFIKNELDIVVKDKSYIYFSFEANPLEDFESENFRGGLDYIREINYGIKI